MAGEYDMNIIRVDIKDDKKHSSYYLLLQTQSILLSTFTIIAHNLA